MNWLSLLGSVVASAAAVTIALVGWRRQDRRDEQQRDLDARKEQARLLADLLELSIAGGGVPTGRDVAKAKAILLQLPGYMATFVRLSLGLRHTMHDVPIDAATAARLKPTEPHDAGHKWWIFARASALNRQSPEARPELVEAEIAYDIAGLLGRDQEAVLKALKRDVRDMDTAIRVHYLKQSDPDQDEAL